MWLKTGDFITQAETHKQGEKVNAKEKYIRRGHRQKIKIDRDEEGRGG